MKKPSRASKTGSPQANGEAAAPAKTKSNPTEKQIRERAYELHILRGGLSHPLVNWLQAEQELKAAMILMAEDKPVESGNKFSHRR